MSIQIPSEQRAWIVVRQGDPRKAVELKTDWPIPKDLTDGDVLVKVHAAALNPVGYKLMKWLPTFLSGRPHIAEQDFSGEIVETKSERFNVGDHVYGWVPVELSMKTHQGALAQYTRVNHDYVVHRPDSVSPVQAAGLSLAGQTAWQALTSIGQLEEGQSVFINGGSSAVGTFAIQIAKAKGAKVTTTCSSRTENFVRGQNPDHVINYQQTNLAKHLAEHPPSPKFHVIFDAVGLNDPSLYTSSEEYIAPNGVFISTGPMPQGYTCAEVYKLFKTIYSAMAFVWLGGAQRRYRIFLVKNERKDMEDFQRLVAEGSIKPVVDSVRKFEDVYEAYDHLKSKRASGKVVVVVDPDINPN